MNKTQVTADHVEYWRAVNHFFGRGYSSKPTSKEARRSIEWALDGRFGGALTLCRIGRDFGSMRDWTFRILEGLSDGHVQSPTTYKEPPKNWDELEREVREHVQGVYLQQRIDCAEEDWVNPWDDETHFVKPVQFFLKNLSPFHTWAFVHRVHEACHYQITDNALEWTQGGGTHNIVATAESAFDEAIRGVERWIEGDKKGVSLSSLSP